MKAAADSLVSRYGFAKIAFAVDGSNPFKEVSMRRWSEVQSLEFIRAILRPQVHMNDACFSFHTRKPNRRCLVLAGEHVQS